MQTKRRTNEREPNENISFPIGTMFLVDKLYEALNSREIFGKHKTRGIDISNLRRALISYKLTDNISKKRSPTGSTGLKCLPNFPSLPLAKEHFAASLKSLVLIGMKSSLKSRMSFFRGHGFEHTNINMDWTSLVLHGNEARLGKYGYSSDHRPDKKQITVGVTEL